ncbi:GntP family permease [Anaeroselena agilis]|uniref:GntP family permease n=1 Tax=Anaeroselena agilis TaxID=3063788 RepID=A0ABU3NUW1_9FIRM|nr:GntP family permease [Selenomonadales bacterium 4137-cl]
MEILGIVLSLFLLMYVAYRGFSVILFAPILALLAASMQGLHVMPTYTELFMTKAVGYVKLFFPVFLLGAVLGKVMEDTGMAKSIAHEIIQALGKERGIIAVVLACAILTYGGVSLFVVVFAVYPFGAAIFREANIPKRLIPGAIALGAFTFTMTMVPGTPQIQNAIPMTFYGTDAFAAKWLGLLAAILTFGCGVAWLEWRRKTAQAAGEGYGDHTLNEPEIKSSDLETPNWVLSLLPLLAVVVVNFAMTKFAWDPNILEPFKPMKLPLMVPAVKNVAGIWALIIGLVVGVILAVGIGYRYLPKQPGSLQRALNTGAIGSLLAIMNTASEVGYGNVISSLPGFKSIATFLLNIKLGGTPLVSEFFTVNILAGITGSASGGMSIALSIMAKEWLAWANQVGLNPELLHRVASMASGGFDTMPHNGAVITLLAVCGMTHVQSYKDIGMTSLVIPFLVGITVILIYTVTGFTG